MKHLIRAFILVAITTSGVESTPWNENVKGWYIGIDENLGNDCYMHNFFAQGTYLRVVLDSDLRDLKFIIGNDNWQSLEEGKLYRLEVQFDKHPPWEGDAGVYSWEGTGKFMLLTVSSVDEQMFTFINELQKSNNVVVHFSGKLVDNLSLKGSSAAMDEVINCFLNINENYRDPFKGT